MNRTDLIHVAADHALTLIGSELVYPFGPDWDVYKVRGRVFMLLTTVENDPLVTVKVAPADSLALRASFPDISPGYHMNKRHWVSIRPGGTVDKSFLEELVTDSYLLVVAKLPRAHRPIDPSFFRMLKP